MSDTDTLTSMVSDLYGINERFQRQIASLQQDVNDLHQALIAAGIPVSYSPVPVPQSLRAPA